MPRLVRRCLALAVLAALPAGAQEPAALRRMVEQAIAAHEGVVGVSVRNLVTGESLSIRGDEPFPGASIVKVAVLVALLHEVERGSIALDEPITMIGRDRVPGTGVLRHLQPGLRITVEDAARLMIVISDNTATNLVLDKLNIRTVWERMEALGLPRTKIHSKTWLRQTSLAMDSSVRYGLSVTTPDEMVRLFTLLHEGRAVSPAMDSLALSILRETEDAVRLTRWLPPGTAVAQKTGEIDRARHACGIVYGPDVPVALCVLTRENADTSYGPDNGAYRMIARISAEVFRHHNPSAAGAVVVPPGEWAPPPHR
jgi:beta-lactamase class A